MSKLTSIHTRLRMARMAGGYKTETEFCKQHGIPISTYNMHESGKRKLMPAVAEKYAEILKVNTVWLITGTGSPYIENFGSDNVSDLTDEEYFDLLNYKGNDKINQPQSNECHALNQVDPILFCKIIIDITDALKQYHINIDINKIATYSVEIYKDIIQSSDAHKDQLKMVPLAITMFKKQLQDKTQYKVGNQ